MPNQSSTSNSAPVRVSILACSILSVLLFAGLTSPAHAVEPKEYTLSNDMKVILVEVPKAPAAMQAS